MNLDKAQSWNGYQEYPTSGNSYIFSDETVKMTFLYCVWIGIYSLWLVAIDTYPEVIKKMYFLLLLLGMQLCPDR